jgi:hypothetical protein
MLLLYAATPAYAYMGPGLGLGVAWTALGIVGAMLLGLVAVVWYPVKRVTRRLLGRDATATRRNRR